MTGDEEASADLGSRACVSNAEEPLREEQTPNAAPTAERLGPRAVPSRDREQAAAQLAATLAGAVAQFLLDTERQALIRADRVRASALDDLERQRANVESLVGMFAKRLRQQEERVSSLQEESEMVLERLNRCAEALRSLSEAQAHHAALLGQLLDVLRLLTETVGSPSAEPPGPAGP